MVTGIARHGTRRVTTISTRSATTTGIHGSTPNDGPTTKATSSPATTTPPMRKARTSTADPAARTSEVGWRRRYTSHPAVAAATLGSPRWPTTSPTPTSRRATTIRVVRFEIGSTDDARLASSSGIATIGSGSTRERRASCRYNGVSSTIVVSRLSTIVVSAARSHSAATGVSRSPPRARAAATASKNPSLSSRAASGTPASRNASAGHSDDRLSLSSATDHPGSAAMASTITST